MSESAVDANTQVSHTDDSGRTLSGMGASVEALEQTMERHAPPEPDAGGTAAKDLAVETGSPAPAALDAKPSRGQQRFSELAKARDAEKARADAAEARAKELEAKISTPPAAPPAVAAEPPPAAAKPERFTFPGYEKFLETSPAASYEEWELERLHAFGAWKDERSDVSTRVRSEIAAERARSTFEETLNATRAKGREVYADFDTVIKSGPGGKVDLHTDEATANRRVAMIVHHPQSEHLQYAIMKDGALAEKLAGMDDIAFGMAVAALVPASTGAPATRQHTPPPAPYQPVNGNSATTQTPSGQLASKGFDFDRSGYREKRAAERKVSRR